MKHSLITASTLLAGLCLVGSVLAQNLAGADLRFLKQAAQNGLAEIEASKLAQTKATSAEVQSFAQHMVEDHTKVAEELNKLAASKGVKLPKDPSIAQRGKLKMLAASEGAKFDRRYADAFGTKAHEETVRLFRNATENVLDPDVKAFAQKTLAGIEQHLAMAKSLQASAPGRKLGSGTTSDKKP